MKKINRFNKKKIIIIAMIIGLIILFAILFAVYISKREVRNWIDINIFRKNVSEQDIQSISLNTDKNKDMQSRIVRRPTDNKNEMCVNPRKILLAFPI